MSSLREGDIGAVHQESQSTPRLSNGNSNPAGADHFRDIFWDYFEPLAIGLDRAVRAEGVSILGELIEAYPPTEQEGVPLGSHVIENVAGRYIVRLRLENDVADIPTFLLESLVAVTTLPRSAMTSSSRHLRRPAGRSAIPSTTWRTRSCGWRDSVFSGPMVPSNTRCMRIRRRRFGCSKCSSPRTISVR